MRDVGLPDAGLPIASDEIVTRRPARNAVDPKRPYAWLSELECNASREVVNIATVFLTNRECPFRCLMCDLWKNTLTHSVEPGDIPTQIRFALEQLQSPSTLQPLREIKLYNSGNFFDAQAIPMSDYADIAELVRGFDSVIVENHPKLCGELCLRFRDLIAPAQLEVALGLETCHPESLKRLNKSMTLANFDSAVEFLHREGIRTRVFLLHGLPYLSPEESTQWTLHSIEYAMQRGVDACSVIATRTGNGVMDELQSHGQFTPPSGESLEQVQEVGIGKRRGRVFVDLWEVDQFFECDECRSQRIDRMRTMNLEQQVLPRIQCDCSLGRASETRSPS